MTSFVNARAALAAYVDNGVATSNSARIDSRINEAQRRLIDHYNFLSRQEESDRPALVWQAGGTTGSPTTGNLILNDLDATKTLILALWREENNDLDRAEKLEQKAYSYVERNLLEEIDRERKAAFQALATASNQNTLGGLTGRIGLETVARYRMTESRIKSYVNQAVQQAIDHHNFVSRNEELSSSSLTFTTLTSNADTFNALLPAEVIRLLALSLILTDNSADGSGLKNQALELIQRNVTASVERSRRDALNEVGRLHNELPDGLTMPSTRLSTLLGQAQDDAEAHFDFIARREDYSGSAAPTTFSFEIRKKLVESYIATAKGAAEIAAAAKQEAFALIERDLVAIVERSRREYTTDLDIAKLHNELPGGLQVPTARLIAYNSQANTEAAAHFNFLARREDYSTGTLPNPFPFEIRKKLVESYLATARGTATAGNDKVVDLSTSLKSEAFALIERDLMAQVEKARREYTADADVAKLHNELSEGLKYPTTRLAAYLSQAVSEATDHFTFLARREDYNTTTPTFPFEIRKKLVEACIAVAQGAPDIANQLKQTALELIERNLMASMEGSRRSVGGEAGQLHNELPDGVKIPTARITKYLETANTEAGAQWDFIARREDYSGSTKPLTFSYEIRKKLVESYVATFREDKESAIVLKQEALATIERDLVATIEASRRAYTTVPEVGQLHNELPDGVKIPTTRLTQYLSTAATEALAHFDFLAKREDYNRTAPAPFPFEIRKKLVESYLATAQAAPDVATKLKQEAFEFIERDLMTAVEGSRRNVADVVGQLHNELSDGVKIPTARLTLYLTQANTEAGAQWDFIARREDYHGSTKPPTFSYEIRKKLVESYVATAQAVPDVAIKLKQEAFELIERDLMTTVEASRRNVVGKDEETRLHNELPDGVKIPTARLTTYLSTATTEATAHYNFLAKREDYNATVPGLFPTFEIRKKLVESYLATAQAAPDVAAKLKQEAFEFIERDLMTAVEASRRAVLTFAGRLHNELPDGVKIPTARIDTYLTTANTEATAHFNFLARREDYKATAPPTFDDEIRKKLVESYVATSRGQADAAAAFKQEAFALVERNLVRSVEEARRDATGEIGRLHNEIAGGLQIPTSRMQTLADQAVTEIRSHQAFLQRREDYSGSRPAVTYEQKKLMIESYLVPAAMTRKNNSPSGSVVVVNGRDEDSKYADAAGAIKASALALVERDIVAMIEDDRRAKRQQLAASSPDTFGYHWGRAGLELPEAYRISDAAIKRLINTAEEQLMLTGKWVGTVESYTLNVTATGEFFLPQEIETILFMSFDNNPRAVHDRYSEWLRGGPGYRGADYTWMQGAVDRGEAPDPADGNKLKRKYFITLPDTVPVVRILGKRRFLPHASDTEKMYLRNFGAVFEAAKGFLLGGDQIAAHMEKATQMLATQIAQQNFTGQPPIRRAVRFMR